MNFLIATATDDIMTSIAIIIATPKLVSSPWFVIVGDGGAWFGDFEGGKTGGWSTEQELRPDSYPYIKALE